MTINVVATFTVKEGSGEAFEAAVAAARPAMLAQDGCERYDLQRRRKSETEYVLLEEYASGDALREHGASDAFTEFGAAVADLVAGPPEIIFLEPVGEQRTA
ncbi:putative quinol monooxygenase [Mumia sp. DW29H23]|uniref:putative quinol monooxygenase n=1 Tax=Mumia sp. DW29H23 TaxID=3421241 RepID=UPI003D68F644